MYCKDKQQVQRKNFVGLLLLSLSPTEQTGAVPLLASSQELQDSSYLVTQQSLPDAVRHLGADAWNNSRSSGAGNQKTTHFFLI